MNPFIQDIKNQYKNGSVLIKLIFVNVAVFLMVNVIGSLLHLFNLGDGVSMFVNWLALPADFSILILKPWTLISYMFLHEGLWHLLMNMLVLYFGSQIFLQFLNEKKMLITYLLGGLSGGLLYILAFNIFPVFSNVLQISIALGASASVMAVLIAAATYVPNFVVRLVFLGNVKLKYIAMVYFVLDIVSIRGANSGGHIAHIGGALFGYFFIQQLKKGKDFTLGFSRFLDYLSMFFKPRKKMKVVYKKQTKTKTDQAYNNQKVANQKKVDIILDKISKSGYDSLSAEEKAILFDASKK
ncbi:MAG: rhomboid family intramembrane serine protease [Flavobacteriales bacterium]|nr:MAG: rhomboid family intramembrane serine protease [Flavobacteriales bacterium]